MNNGWLGCLGSADFENTEWRLFNRYLTGKMMWRNSLATRVIRMHVVSACSSRAYASMKPVSSKSSRKEATLASRRQDASVVEYRIALSSNTRNSDRCMPLP
jgi:hypothetical protein